LFLLSFFLLLLPLIHLDNSLEMNGVLDDTEGFIRQPFYGLCPAREMDQPAFVVGVDMGGIGQGDDACRTFSEPARRVNRPAFVPESQGNSDNDQYEPYDHAAARPYQPLSHGIASRFGKEITQHGRPPLKMPASAERLLVGANRGRPWRPCPRTRRPWRKPE